MCQLEAPEYKCNLRVFLIDDGEKHWIIAGSLDSALVDHVFNIGYHDITRYLEDMGPIDLRIVPASQDIAVSYEGETVTKTASGWASGHVPGPLCSTVNDE